MAEDVTKPSQIPLGVERVSLVEVILPLIPNPLLIKLALSRDLISLGTYFLSNPA